MATHDLEVKVGILEAQLREARIQAAKREAELEATLFRIEEISDQWRTILDALPELVLSVSPGGVVLRANRTLEAWSLGSLAEVRGTDLHELLHPSCTLGASCYIEETWRELEQSPPENPIVVEGEDPVLRRRLRVTFRSLSATSADHEPCVWAVVVAEDITEDRRRQNALTQKLRLETVAHLIRGFAHEIGNPLASVKATVQVLSHSWDRFGEDKKRVYVDRIHDGAERIQKIVDRSLRSHLWQIESLRPVSIEERFESIQETFSPRARRQRITFVVQAPTGGDLRAMADAEALEATMGIVLDNSLDACDDGDRVSVRARSLQDEVRIEIRDSGHGIAESDLRSVFQPFFTTKPQSSGLGMSHADHLMSQMGGRIEITSRVGAGTTVALVLREASER